VWKETESTGPTDLYAIDIDEKNLVQLTHMESDQNCYVIEFSPKGWRAGSVEAFRLFRARWTVGLPITPRRSVILHTCAKERTNA
jgi:hypothetical protein